METILQILQWAIPSGLGTAIGWFWNRRVNQAKAKKEIHDTFKQMYEDVSSTLLALQNENKELHATINDLQEKDALTRRAINRLSRAIEAIPLCNYHSQCPVLGELRLEQEDGEHDDKSTGEYRHSDGRQPGAERSGRLPETGKLRTGTVNSKSRKSPRGRGIQPSGRQSARVGKADKG